MKWCLKGNALFLESEIILFSVFKLKHDKLSHCMKREVEIYCRYMLKVQRGETQPKGVVTADNMCKDLCLKDGLEKVKLSLVIDDTRRSTER